MVTLSAYTLPESGVVHQEPQTEAYIKERSYGNGTLYITEGKVLWIGSEGNGFGLDYPNISIHAVSRDTSTFPRECLYMMLDINLDEDRIIEDDNSDDESSIESTEVRFVPTDKDHLDIMYQAMCTCQELHPDPEQDDSGDDFYGDEECIGDGPQLSAQGISNLERMEQMLSTNGQNGDTNEEAMEDDGQFDDAEQA